LASFSLEIDGVQIAGIAEVSGLALEQDVIETKETAADGTVIIRKLPGRPKAGEVTLIRGLTADLRFENWVRALRSDPATARKTGSISVFNFEGARLRRYRLHGRRAWRSARSRPVTPRSSPRSSRCSASGSSRSNQWSQRRNARRCST
jgi:phage tail-like protein